MKNRPPFKLGVTGGIGSGKSVVCQVLEALRVPVYYADDRAKWLMNHDEKLKRNIEALFGQESYLRGELDRRYVASKIFSDPELLKRMNKLIHPAVKQDFEKWSINQSKGIVAKEAALLFETGSYMELDKTWLVTCPVEKKVERIKKRDPSRSEEEILSIMDKQWSDEEKLPLSNTVLINDDAQLLIPQVLTALEYSQR